MGRELVFSLRRPDCDHWQDICPGQIWPNRGLQTKVMRTSIAKARIVSFHVATTSMVQANWSKGNGTRSLGGSSVKTETNYY